MCIICNLPGNEDTANEFLCNFEAARQSMAKATADMLKCSRQALDPANQKQYDKIHKEMVRLTRRWNQLEGEREQVEVPHQQEPMA